MFAVNTNKHWQPLTNTAGALQAAYNSAMVAGEGGDYVDFTPRYFTCQTCHMRPVDGPGCNKKGVPARLDLPLHDMTGGNYWMPDAIKYLDPLGKLRLGGGLTTTQIAALDAGAVRAIKQLSEAASLSVSGNILTITNLTGHKLISGYPEGRRMWLNIIWYDQDGNVVREDGAYGEIGTVVINPATGLEVTVKSIQDLDDPNTKIYEAHYGMTQEWASQLISLGYDPGLPLSYDRNTGIVDFTLVDLADEASSSTHETFHFVLNNTVVKDNRIPPYGFNYELARQKNALPEPAAQYLSMEAGSVYNHFDEFVLNPPAGAIYAEIKLMYQPTSWEYIQFLALANTGSSLFLADEGVNLLEAWLNTGMAEPYVMVSTTWGSAPTPPIPSMFAQSLKTWVAGKRGVVTETSVFTSNDTVIIEAVVKDENEKSLDGAQVFVEVTDTLGAQVVSLQGFSDVNGSAVLQWKIPRRQTTGEYTAKVTNIIKNNYYFDDTIETKVIFEIQ